MFPMGSVFRESAGTRTGPRRAPAPELVHLDPDHPGFRDRAYRSRRDAIARIALAYCSGEVVPDVAYSPAENGVWRRVATRLRGLHTELAAREIVTLQGNLGLPSERVPQLAQLNPVLSAATGFRMEPVAGLARADAFLERLGEGVLLSTQYIRHASRPLYTPEPDAVHELLGHAATLLHPRVAELSRQFGRTSSAATPAELDRIERVYWYAMEFGLVEEGGAVKVFGAGLLSSCGELEQLSTGPELCDWDLERMAETPYEPTAMQPRLFVASSFADLLSDVSAWLGEGRWRS